CFSSSPPFPVLTVPPRKKRSCYKREERGPKERRGVKEKKFFFINFFDKLIFFLKKIVKD
ncbi:hypothetical protein, partial [Helicobacter pylori]|uniref:hypothetical protein n=1 Tax=Helicobacter pylori TaxID=210 RepID=UPI001EE4C70C